VTDRFKKQKVLSWRLKAGIAETDIVSKGILLQVVGETEIKERGPPADVSTQAVRLSFRRS